MNSNRPMRPSGHDSNMYDDTSRAEDYYHGSSSSQGYQNPRQDYPRSPPRGQRGQRPPYGERQIMDDRQHDYDRRRSRSRSPRREGRGRYTDRDREDYHSPPQDRSRSRSRSPYFGGPPNRNVILEGLSLEWTQEDVGRPISPSCGSTITPSCSYHKFGHCGRSRDLQILNELQHELHVEGVEEVRVIKDKRTGQSRGFAFAQFVDISQARRFLDRFYPNVHLYGPQHGNNEATTEPAKVRIAYSRDREDRDRAGKGEDDWKCDICYLPNFSHRTLCFRCNAPRTRATAHGIVVAQANMSAFSGFATTGDSDVSPDGTASQFLLFRGLEPSVTEELLAKGVNKLCKTKAGTPPSEAQNAKKRQIASTTTDVNLGAKEGSLRRILLVRDRKTNDSWRYGFAEFATVEDAQAAMAKYKASDKFTIASKPVMTSYIHAGVFVPVLHALDEEQTKFTFSPLLNQAIKLMYWDEAAYARELAVAVPDPPSAIKSKESEHAKRTAAAASEGLIGNGKDGEPRLKKRKVDKDTKVVAPHLQFWTNRHAELHGIPSKEPSDNVADDRVPTTEKKPAAPIKTPPTRSFADLERKCCLLCSRQFKTEAEVTKHERASQLHKDNMKNENLVAKALAKLNKSKAIVDEGAAYRDRAKERRQAFNQPKQPAAQHNRPSKDSNGDASTKKAKEESPPVQSKGAALLGKMGWSAGEGLGAQGTGRTEAIVTELYAQGVGLGAQGGKVGDAVEEAARQTQGSYADFVNKAKDKAKERFQSMA